MERTSAAKANVTWQLSRHDWKVVPFPIFFSRAFDNLGDEILCLTTVGYPPICTIVLDAGTKSGSPMWWRSSFFWITPRMKSSNSSSLAPRSEEHTSELQSP